MFRWILRSADWACACAKDLTIEGFIPGLYIYNDPEIVSFCLLHNPNQNGNIFEHPIFIHILANVGRIYIYSIEEEEEEECMLNKMRLL